jgi:hypothetical protein
VTGVQTCALPIYDAAYAVVVFVVAITTLLAPLVMRIMMRDDGEIT